MYLNKLINMLNTLIYKSKYVDKPAINEFKPILQNTITLFFLKTSRTGRIRTSIFF
jgi:hypothetical protein